MSVSTLDQISFNDNEPQLIAAGSSIPEGSWSYIPSIWIGQIAGILTAGADRVREVFFNAAPKEERAQGMSRCGLRIAPKREDLCGICRDEDEPFTEEDYRENTQHLDNQAVTCATGTHAGFHWKCVREWLAEHNHCFIDNTPFVKEGYANPAFSWRRVLAPIAKSAGIAAGMTFSTGAIAVAIERALEYTGLFSKKDMIAPIYLTCIAASSFAYEHFAGLPGADLLSFFSYELVQLWIGNDTYDALEKAMITGILQFQAAHIALLTLPLVTRIQTVWSRAFNDFQLPELHRIDIVSGNSVGTGMAYLATVWAERSGFTETSPEIFLCIATVLSGMITTAITLRRRFAIQ